MTKFLFLCSPPFQLHRTQQNLTTRITTPRMTFIADERFQSFYVENTGLWTLQIKYVQVSGEDSFVNGGRGLNLVEVDDLLRWWEVDDFEMWTAWWGIRWRSLPLNQWIKSDVKPSKRHFVLPSQILRTKSLFNQVLLHNQSSASFKSPPTPSHLSHLSNASTQKIRRMIEKHKRAATPRPSSLFSHPKSISDSVNDIKIDFLPSLSSPSNPQKTTLKARDAGLYECQVSTEPKVSARVHLHVVGELIFERFYRGKAGVL